MKTITLTFPVSGDDLLKMTDEKLGRAVKSLLSKTAEKPIVKKVPPSVEDVARYIKERQEAGRPRVDPEKFFDYYESNGWMVGKSKMKDWTAAVRTWERREAEAKPFSSAVVPSRTGRSGVDAKKAAEEIRAHNQNVAKKRSEKWW